MGHSDFLFLETLSVIYAWKKTLQFISVESYEETFYFQIFRIPDYMTQIHLHYFQLLLVSSPPLLLSFLSRLVNKYLALCTLHMRVWVKYGAGIRGAISIYYYEKYY